MRRYFDLAKNNNNKVFSIRTTCANLASPTRLYWHIKKKEMSAIKMDVFL